MAKPLTQRFRRHEFGWKMLATLLSRMGQHAQALEPMQQAAALSPQDAEAHSNLGVTLKALGHLDQAERCFRRALAVASDYTPARLQPGQSVAGARPVARGSGPAIDVPFKSPPTMPRRITT
ncbi:MAG: tetratricopeptide repeat protein [Rhodoferax sp.]|nr:tetratricopeptide repeat protein [Rhodoferax sp.]